MRVCVCLYSDSKGLSNPGEVEALREKVYASLEAYCKQKYPDQPGRYEYTFLYFSLFSLFLHSSVSVFGRKCFMYKLYMYNYVMGDPVMTYCTSTFETTSCLNPCLIFCHANHCFVSLIGLGLPSCCCGYQPCAPLVWSVWSTCSFSSSSGTRPSTPSSWRC